MFPSEERSEKKRRMKKEEKKRKGNLSAHTPRMGKKGSGQP